MSTIINFRRNAGRYSLGFREQAGSAQRDGGRGGHRDIWAPKHAEPAVVHPVGVCDDWRWPLRGLGLDVSHAHVQEEVRFPLATMYRKNGNSSLRKGWGVRVLRLQFKPLAAKMLPETHKQITAEIIEISSLPEGMTEDGLAEFLGPGINILEIC